MAKQTVTATEIKQDHGSFAIMGDPNSIGLALNNFLAKNPSVRIVTVTATTVEVPGKFQMVGAQSNKTMNVLYVVFSGEVTDMSQFQPPADVKN